MSPASAPTGCCDVVPGHEHLVLDVDGLCCADEARLIDRRLEQLDGVAAWRSDTIARRVHVTHDPVVIGPASIAAAIGDTGMRARVPRASAEVAGRSRGARRWRDVHTLGAAAVATLLAIGADVAGAHRMSAALAMAAVILSGRGAFVRAVAAMRAHVLDIHVLMAVAVVGAVVLGELVEAASVVVLFAVAQALERASMERAHRALSTLVAITPERAAVLDGDEERHVLVDDVATGSRILVRPGDRVPLDGYVVRGASDLDESPVTGESVPVTRRVGDAVFAGSLNGTGALDVIVSRPAADSTLARIASLVERAQAERAPTQQFIDRFARVYTPVILAIAALVAVGPPLVAGAAWGTWVYRGLVLLVIGCPCALVIATPVSFVSALAGAARHGLLVKGGRHLERLAAVRTVAFDKTGTLTSGEIAVHDVASAAGVDADTVTRFAAAVEARSEHPVARAIVAEAKRRGLVVPTAEHVVALPGRGAEGEVDGLRVVVGGAHAIAAQPRHDASLRDQVAEFDAAGHGIVGVERGGTLIGVFAVSDGLRPGAVDATTALRRAGVGRVVVLSGDRRVVAERIGGAVGADAVHAELLPEAKVAHVRALRRVDGAVAMVGDGINDAPALAAADVGIAMGAAASPIAIETADMAVLGDDPGVVAYAVRLARATMRTIRTNVALAVGIKVLFLALAVSGHTSMWLAVLADTGASVLVVTHALHLLRVQ